MLKSIYIQNYALIDKLDISFGKGFSVITGETGAGKSIILGAIGLLIGQRADSKVIKNGAGKCVIEARFDISAYDLEEFFGYNELEYDPQECILRRELQASGKSRAFVNDSPAPLTLMKELGERLIDIHSQHQNLLLSHEEFQLEVLDTLAGNEKEVKQYKDAYTLYKETVAQIERLKEEARRSKDEEDYIRFQFDQLNEARLDADEQEALEQEAETLNHAEEIKAGLYKVSETLANSEASLLPLLKDCTNTLRHLQNVFQPAAELSGRMESCYIELKDIAQEAGNLEESVGFNPERLAAVNERLDLIYALEQKHHVRTVQELLEIEEGFRKKLDSITSSDDRIRQLEIQRDAQFEDIKKAAAVLTKKRTRAAQDMEQKMCRRLIPLGMPNVRFQIEVSPRKEPGAMGADNVVFLFSANKNGLLQPVASIASGGEIARVMLSIKALVSGTAHLPTIIFDEVDTGVSGEIADRMASIMQEMGRNMQVISITHLPQIAAKGAAHYKVFKQDTGDGTSSNIRLLAPEERIGEIAQMLSGSTLTEAAVNNAKELLKTELTDS